MARLDTQPATKRELVCASDLALEEKKAGIGEFCGDYFRSLDLSQISTFGLGVTATSFRGIPAMAR